MKLALLIAALSLVASSAYANNCGHGGMAGHMASVAVANNASVGHVTAAIAASEHASPHSAATVAADNVSVGRTVAAIQASEHASTVAADNAAVGRAVAAIEASEHNVTAPAAHSSAHAISPVQAFASAIGGLFRR